MLYNLAIVIYDLLVHFAAPFSRKPRKMMKGHWVVYELLRQPFVLPVTKTTLSFKP